MNKLTKIGLTALAGSLMVGTVNAADWSISGTSSMTFSGGDDTLLLVMVGLWVTHLLLKLQVM